MRHPQSHAPSHQRREQKEDISGDLQTACYQNVSNTDELPLRSAVRCFTNLLKSGGGGGIRTHGTLASTTVFETAPFDHSGTPPLLKLQRFSDRRVGEILQLVTNRSHEA